MNKKSLTILNLMAFTSLICLSGPVMAATAKSGATPALQISDAPWSPPGPPTETASAAQAPALEISDELWQPAQGTAQTPAPAPVSDKTAVPPPALYVPGSEPAESQPAPQKQSLPPVQQAQNDVQLKKAGTVSEPPSGTAEDMQKIQTEQKRIDSAAAKNTESDDKTKTASAQSSVVPSLAVSQAASDEAKPAEAQASIAPVVASPAKAAPVPASVAAAVPPADTQVLKTMQNQIDTLAKDNAELQQKLKTSSASPAPVTSHSTVVASSDSTDKVRITKAEPEQMHVVKFNMKDDDAAGLPALAPASGGPADASAPLPGKNDPAPATIKVDNVPANDSLKDERTASSKAKAASSGNWQEESAAASEPAQVGELDKLKKRYEMSESENARLGGLVKTEKDQCELDKGKMQKLLFDTPPSDEQQRYITELEHKLGESQQALAEQKHMYEQKIRALKSKHAAHDSES